VLAYGSDGQVIVCILLLMLLDSFS